MLRFTIRDLIWLTVVVAVALVAYFVTPHRQTRWEYRIDYSLTNRELNEAGNDGWELVNAEGSPNLTGTAFYFKRRK